jgi:branched-chain amino acid aminotransferase
MKFSIFNNEIVNSNEIILSNTNRGFSYGDGFFETIKFFKGSVFNFQNHFKRIIFSASLLDLKFDLTILELEILITKIININNLLNGSVKIIIYRESEGKYLPLTNKSSFYISCTKDSSDEFVLNTKSLKIDLYKDNFKSDSPLSNIKSLNSLLYVMASIYAKKNNFDDVLIFNSNKRIIESTNSNLFLFSDDVIYTPPLSDGCVDGTMRRLIVDILKIKYTISIESITESQLLSSNEIFLTNSFSGVKWVGSFKNSGNKNKSVCSYVIDSLNNLI